MRKTIDCPECGTNNYEFAERCYNCRADLSDVPAAYH